MVKSGGGQNRVRSTVVVEKGLITSSDTSSEGRRRVGKGSEKRWFVRLTKEVSVRVLYRDELLEVTEEVK